MKRINILTLCSLYSALILLAGCSKSFLMNEPKGKELETNYYKNTEELYSGLISAYSILSKEISDRSNSWYNSKLVPLNAASDECYAGGGSASDQQSWQAMSNYKLLSPTMGPQAGFWGNNFDGIYRANIVLEKASGPIPGLTDANKDRFIAEAKFLRAYYNFELVRLFKNIPLINRVLKADEWYTIQQASPDEIYQQIELDLKAAIPNLPINIPASEQGRASQGAAMALLGKAILYQNKENRMGEAAEWFDKVASSGAYALLENFGDIFSPEKKFNKEAILEIPHTSSQNATWEHADIMGNIYPTIIGPRAYVGATYYGGGYGFNPIIEAFALEMKDDPRYGYTILNMDSLQQANPGTSYSKSFQNSGYFIKKYAPLKKYEATSGIAELNWPNDYIEIRLADVYLMAAEALVRAKVNTVGSSGRTAQWYLDQVRARVKLPTVTATLENIYKERKMELATEGHRYFDLIRTGQAVKVLAFKGFEANKNEILPIPLNELNNTALKQNTNY